MINKIFITAKPRTGKSTAIRKIVDLLGKENCSGFLTEEIRVDGCREGFRIITLDGREGVLASTSSNSLNRLGRYGIELERFEELCISSIKDIPKSKNYIIIDEVGPMQLLSEDFKQELINIISDKNQVIGTVFYGNHPWIDKFKNQEEIELVEITFGNRDELPSQIVSRFASKNI